MKRSADTTTLRSFGIAVAVFFFGLAVLYPIETGSDFFFWGPFFDAGHYPLFFIVTLFLSSVLPSEIYKLPSSINNPILIAALLAIGIEGIQPLVERDASIPDILNGLLGVAAAGVFLEVWRRKSSWTARLITVLSLGGLFFALLLPLVPAKQSIDWRRNNFPTLASFADSEETRLWAVITPEAEPDFKPSKIAVVSADTLTGGRALAVTTASGHWAGVRYAAGDFSWEGYSHLALRIINPSDEEFSLYIRIDDQQDCEKFHQRFNGSLRLSPGINKLSVTIKDIQNGPRDRKLDISSIRRVLLFTNKKDKTRRFFIDQLDLR